MALDAFPAAGAAGSHGDPPERYQLAGQDALERGFNRPVEFQARGGDFCAVLRYESLRITSSPAPSQASALEALIRHLHQQGYRQLRTQLSFRGGEYLGNRELWVEYPDPVPPPSGLWERLRRWVMGEGAPSTRAGQF